MLLPYLPFCCLLLVFASVSINGSQKFSHLFDFLLLCFFSCDDFYWCFVVVVFTGKSAILAAIQICLGAGASRTHRAKKIKDLVRKETTNSAPCQTAKLKVTVLNGGSDGYKPDIYGNEISVVRCISLRSGYNGYKLLDVNGNEKSRSKKDLDDMLDHLNIQVDNPVAILDQEEAKKFLQGKASEKYGFFMKATELERIDRIYAAAADSAMELNHNKQKLADTLDQKRELLITLKKKYDEHQLLEKLERKAMDHRVDYCWAFYQERNAEYEESLEVSWSNSCLRIFYLSFGHICSSRKWVFYFCLYIFKYLLYIANGKIQSKS